MYSNLSPRDSQQAHSDPLLIQENYSSANITPQKSQPGAGQTPKSILRESLNSGSKMKRNIQINESLNETRKYSMASSARERHYDPDFIQSQRERGHRPNTTIGGSLHGRYGSYYSSGSYEQGSLGDRFEIPHSHSYYRGDTPLEATYDYTEGGFSEQDFTEFQKAYIRKLQREREQEISQNLERLSRLDNPNPSLQQDSVEEANNEEKIHELENNLRQHRKKLKASIKRQEENLAQHKIEPKDAKPADCENKKREKPKIQPQHRPLQKLETTEIENKNIQSPPRSPETPITIQTQTRKQNYLQELNQISKLVKEQNENLRCHLSTTQKLRNRIEGADPIHTLSNIILEKEQELLKVINKIQNKMNKSHARSQPESFGNTHKKCTQKKPKDVYTEKRDATRKLYGAKKLEVDNSNFLHQGLSTTYNDFHWYADQSLQLTKQLY